MTSPVEDPPARRPKPRLLQWVVLVTLSGLLAGVLEWADLPAPFLIGPMLTAIGCGVAGFSIRVTPIAFNASQTLIGCVIAGSIELAIFATIAADWPIIAMAVLSTVAASSFLGWSISRLRILPGTTGVWGSAPGAATAMVLMASAFGADSRLVAFMLYLRVILVTVTAAFVASHWVDTTAFDSSPAPWFPHIDGPLFLATLAVAAAGGTLGTLLRLPSPWFLGAFALGLAVHLSLGLEFQVPQWLLAATYVAVGWTIGLRFDREVLMHAGRALPQIILSIVILMGFCGGIAWLLASELGIDPLTAYLATSPGGMDSVAIIAAASAKVDLSFVMALQTARFFFVLLVGPALARLVARSLAP